MSTDHESAFRSALNKVGLTAPEEPTRTGDAVEPKEEHVKAELPDTHSGVMLANVWRHPDAHPVVLDLLLLRKFGPAWLTWEPEALELILPGELGVPSVSELNFQKIQACKTLHVIDSFWERWEVFLPCAMALNGEFPSFEILQVPTVAQCLVAIDIANRLRDDVKWTQEIKTFLGTVCLHDGVLLPLPPMDFVSIDTENLPVDLVEVKRRWPEVRGSGKAPSGDTVEDEQLRRLLLVNDFLEESRTRLHQQLRMIAHA